jgi:hypothetical protein
LQPRGGIYLEIFAKNFQDKRVHFAGGSLTCAIDLKAIASRRAEEELGEDAALGVAGAKKEDSEFGMHRPRFHR